MIRHWTTLAALVEQLKGELAGSVLVDCIRTPGREVWFIIETAHGTLALVFAPEQPIGSLYVRRSPPPRVHERVLPLLAMQPVRAIDIADSNRIITLTLGDYHVHILAIPGARANCVVCNGKTGDVVAFLRAMPGLELAKPWEPPPGHLLDPQQCPPTMKLGEVLAQSCLLLAEPYARRFSSLVHFDLDTEWGLLSHDERERVVSHALDYRRRLILTPEPVIACRDGVEQFFLEPHVDGSWQIEPVTTVEEGILRRARSIYREWALDQARRTLERQIATELRHIDHALAALEQQIAEEPNAETLDQWGHLLIAHPERHQRGLDRLETVAWDGQSIVIPLDPSRTVLKNAEQYFAKARKIRRGAEFARTRSVELYSRKATLESARTQLHELKVLGHVEDLARQLYPQPTTARAFEQRIPEPMRSRVRTIALEGGYVLLVGKDARSNDELTFHIARPHDVWLHARGVEGAHGIIPLATRELPPKSVIEQAAAIVAYFSAARTATYVPVSWTQRKYLRKPKGTAPGTVQLMRETVVFVEPRAPSEAE